MNNSLRTCTEVSHDLLWRCHPEPHGPTHSFATTLVLAIRSQQCCLASSSESQKFSQAQMLSSFTVFFSICHTPKRGVGPDNMGQEKKQNYWSPKEDCFHHQNLCLFPFQSFMMYPKDPRCDSQIRTRIRSRT